MVGGVDLDKVLLPKKGPAPETLTRVNAGAVLEASIPMPAAPRAPVTSEELQSLRQDIRRDIGKPPKAPGAQIKPETATAAPEKPPAAQAEGSVASVRTYKRDIEDTVREKNVSLVSIAAAQARREERRPEEATPKAAVKRYTMVGGGIVLIVLALAALAYVLLPQAPAQPKVEEATPPLIHVDMTERITVGADDDRLTLLQKLEAARKRTSIALGLVERLYVVESASSSVSGAEREFPASAFIGLLAPNAPPALPRSLSDRFLLGIHSFDGNQPFLIFKTTSFEQTYAGMLAWEPSMRTDLLPLFERKPRPRIPEEGTSTPSAAPQVNETGFVDRIVENHDARVVENGTGDILLLWAFVNRETLVIATNEYSLREAITRLKSPPLVPIPGQ